MAGVRVQRWRLGSDGPRSGALVLAAGHALPRIHPRFKILAPLILLSDDFLLAGRVERVVHRISTTEPIEESQ